MAVGTEPAWARRRRTPMGAMRAAQHTGVARGLKRAPVRLDDLVSEWGDDRSSFVLARRPEPSPGFRTRRSTLLRDASRSLVGLIDPGYPAVIFSSSRGSPRPTRTPSPRIGSKIGRGNRSIPAVSGVVSGNGSRVSLRAAGRRCGFDRAPGSPARSQDQPHRQERPAPGTNRPVADHEAGQTPRGVLQTATAPLSGRRAKKFENPDRRSDQVFIESKKSPLLLVWRSLSSRNSIASVTPIGLRMRRST